MPKGKTPSLIGSSLGRPKVDTAGKSLSCSRCGVGVPKGAKCYVVPQPSKPFNSPRRFCPACFQMVLEQSKKDLQELESL